jgi:putative heme iron utilization protein
MKKILTFNDFIKESVESNQKEAALLDQKQQLLIAKQGTQDELEKTKIESQIAKIDAEIEAIRNSEKEEQQNIG